MAELRHAEQGAELGRDFELICCLPEGQGAWLSMALSSTGQAGWRDGGSIPYTRFSPHCHPDAPAGSLAAPHDAGPAACCSLQGGVRC